MFENFATFSSILRAFLQINVYLRTLRYFHNIQSSFCVKYAFFARSLTLSDYAYLILSDAFIFNSAEGCSMCSKFPGGNSPFLALPFSE